MRTTPVARAAVAASLLAVPLLNLVAALLAGAGGVQSDTHAEVAAIAAHPDRYYLFTLAQLVGSWLLIPAVSGIRNLLRPRRPVLADVAGGVLLLGLLVAIGDSAVGLVWWQTAAPGADADQMAALIDRTQTAAGASAPYAIAAVAMLAGSVALTVGLSRTKAAPTWAAVTLPAGIVTNIVGFAAASQALLIASAVILLAGFTRFAALVWSPSSSTADVAAAPLPVASGAGSH